MNKNNDKQKSQKSKDNSDFTKKTQKKKAGQKKKPEMNMISLKILRIKYGMGLKDYLKLI